MSLQIIIQDIKLFGELTDNKNKGQNQETLQLRRFRMSLGDNTYLTKEYGFSISANQLVFDQAFSFHYDNQSIILHVQIFREHQQLFDNSDIQDILFAEFDLSDISNTIGDILQTTLFNFNNQAIGKMTIMIEVFKKGSMFTQKVTYDVLFETVKKEKEKQIKASAASKNIKNLMINNVLTNTLMTINYFQIKPQKQDPQIFNRECFILIRYGFTIKSYTKVIKSLAKQNISWVEYQQFMKNQDVKFEFFFMFYDELGILQCKAKGEIKYIVFDQTINNHCIVMFDKRSTIYGDLLIKFIQKQVQVVNIQNKISNKLIKQQTKIMQSIDEFNRFKFQSTNNNRILSQKLRQLQVRQLQEQQEKMQPFSAEVKKKSQQHSRFIQFLQKQVIKIQRELKKREISQRRDERKVIYQPNTQATEMRKDKKFGVSMTSSQFRQDLPKIDEIEQSHIIPQNVDKQI